MVEEALRERNLPIVIVLPSTAIGEYDYKLTPSNRMILRFARGVNFVYIPGGINVVHVSDVAEGHWRALIRGRVGEKYILGSHNITLRDLITAISRLTGRSGPKLCLSRKVVYPAAVLFDLWERLTNHPAPISKMQAKTRVGKFGFYSIEKAKKDLGYRPMDFETSLRRSLEWFRLRGLIGSRGFDAWGQVSAPAASRRGTI
jgi:dihydroflavonol-4-reductase